MLICECQCYNRWEKSVPCVYNITFNTACYIQISLVSEDLVWTTAMSVCLLTYHRNDYHYYSPTTDTTLYKKYISQILLVFAGYSTSIESSQKIPQIRNLLRHHGSSQKFLNCSFQISQLDFSHDRTAVKHSYPIYISLKS